MSWRNLYLTLFMLVSVICIDQISKLIIVEIIMHPPRVIAVLPNLNFVLSHNTGVSFGLFASQFQSSQILLIALTSIISVFVFIWGGIFNRTTAEALCAGLISGGAVGNIIDRSLRGAVTDFIDIQIAGLSWPAFNLADMAIVLSAIFLVLTSARSRIEQEHKNDV